MPTNSSSAGRPYGVITLDGQQYVERHQVFVTEDVISTPNQVITNLRLTLPGVANFLLKGLTRLTRLAGNPTLLNDIFRFRLVNSEGTTWFFTGGLGILDDRAISSLCFGDGQFPFPVIPPVPVHATGSLVYELEDAPLFPVALDPYPYTIDIGWHGTYLFPVDEIATKGPLAFPGVTNGIIRTG